MSGIFRVRGWVDCTTFRSGWGVRLQGLLRKVIMSISTRHSKLLAECVVLCDPNDSCFIAFLGKNFRKFGVCVVLWDSTFLEKICQKFDAIVQKIYVLRFKMVSNGKILKNLDEITYKNPHRPFSENFEVFEIF